MRVLAILLCFVVSPVWAGAWMRAEGQGFAAPSINSSGAGSTQAALFVEYGLTPKLTLGLDLSRGQTGSASALVFARMPLWQSDNGNRLSVFLGGGQDQGDPVFRTGLSYGRGISTRWGGGWIGIDTFAKFNLTTGFADYKLDTTVGISPADKWKAIVQVQAALQPGRSHSVTLAPSIVVRLRTDLHLELGLTHSLRGTRDTGVKLGLWIDF